MTHSRVDYYVIIVWLGPGCAAHSVAPNGVTQCNYLLLTTRALRPAQPSSKAAGSGPGPGPTWSENMHERREPRL